MAEDEAEGDEYEYEEESSPFLNYVMAGLNTLAVLGMLGVVVYTKVLHKRPVYTETEERTKIDAKPVAAVSTEDLSTPVEINGVQINIQGKEDPNDARKQPKLHYVEFSVALIASGHPSENSFEDIKPIFMDRLIALVGRKTFENLTTVQGRFLLRTEIQDLANEVTKGSTFSQVYFTNFIVM